MTKHSTSEVVMYLQFIKKTTNHINFNNGDRQEFKHFEQIKKKYISLLKKGQTVKYNVSPKDLHFKNR